MEVYETLEQEKEWKTTKDIEVARLKEKTQWGVQEELRQVQHHRATQQRQIKQVRNDLGYELSALEKTRRQALMKVKVAEIDLG